MLHKGFMKNILSACICTVVVLICLLGIAVNAEAATVVDSGTCGENLTWTLDSEGVLTISGSGPMTEYYWVGDVPWYSSYSVIKSAVIEDGVTTVGSYAFEGCNNLTSVIIGESVTSINSSAFYRCSSLTTITIPASVISISVYAFYDCSSLTKINVDKNNLNYSSVSGVLFNKAKTDLLKVPNAFSGSYTIPSSVTRVGNSAFYGCSNLTSVTIPDSVTTIGTYAFFNCDKLVSVTIPDSVTSVSNSAFSSCDSLKTVTIPDSITSIGGNAFSYCSSLAAVTIPESVTSIGSLAFYECTSLVTVTIPGSVTTIDWEIFGRCTGLTSVRILDGVTTIGERAFNACINITEIIIPDSIIRVDSSAFGGCNSLQFNTYNNAKYLGNAQNPYYALIKSSSKDIKTCKVHSSTKLIADGAFESCSKMTSITIPEGVEIICGSAFSHCSNLASVTFPESIDSIGGYAFAYCTGLTSVTIPSGVTHLYNDIFAGCSNIQTVFFKGDANRDTYGSIFPDITATAYYPADNDTWTEIWRPTYGASLTWVSWTPFEINAQPKTAYAIMGDSAKTTVKAAGDGLTYQWYVKNAGATEYSISSIKTATYSCKMSATTNGRYVKCKITDQYGNSVVTRTARLWMKDLEITTQPTTQKVKDGITAKFKVVANSTNVTYQWQYRKTSSGSWKNASAAGNKTATLSVPATVSRSAYQYRCKVTDSAGNVVYTNAVNLYVLGIKTQPVSKTVVEDKTVKFTVAATGASKKYQWQYRTSSDGSWKNASATGNKTKTLSVPASVSRHGYQYRCKITDSAGNVIYTKTVNLYVLGIKTQPASKTVKAGAAVKFTVKATGRGLIYQWQYKTSEGSWKNVSAASGKTANYSLTAKSRHNGYQYRCRITDSAGNVIYTSIVKLIVKS